MICAPQSNHNKLTVVYDEWWGGANSESNIIWEGQSSLKKKIAWPLKNVTTYIRDFQDLHHITGMNAPTNVQHAIMLEVVKCNLTIQFWQTYFKYRSNVTAAKRHQNTSTPPQLISTALNSLLTFQNMPITVTWTLMNGKCENLNCLTALKYTTPTCHPLNLQKNTFRYRCTKTWTCEYWLQFLSPKFQSLHNKPLA